MRQLFLSEMDLVGGGDDTSDAIGGWALGGAVLVGGAILLFGPVAVFARGGHRNDRRW